MPERESALLQTWVATAKNRVKSLALATETIVIDYFSPLLIFVLVGSVSIDELRIHFLVPLGRLNINECQVASDPCSLVSSSAFTSFIKFSGGLKSSIISGRVKVVTPSSDINI